LNPSGSKASAKLPDGAEASRTNLKNMKVIPDFENELKKIDSDLSIKVNPQFPEMAGVYWKHLYICALPSGEIYDEVKNLYVNTAGLVHRTRPMVLSIVLDYLRRIKGEKGFYEDEISFNEKE